MTKAIEGNNEIISQTCSATILFDLQKIADIAQTAQDVSSADTFTDWIRHHVLPVLPHTAGMCIAGRLSQNRPFIYEKISWGPIEIYLGCGTEDVKHPTPYPVGTGQYPDASAINARYDSPRHCPLLGEWSKDDRPKFVNSMQCRELTSCIAACAELPVVGNCLVHGWTGQGSFSSLYIFFTLPATPESRQTLLLDILAPHIHRALSWVSARHGAKSRREDSKIKHAPGLTKREQEILTWICLGKTNSEIATILTISPLTVKNHVQNLLVKLKVGNRSQAVRKSLLNHWIDTS